MADNENYGAGAYGAGPFGGKPEENYSSISAIPGTNPVRRAAEQFTCTECNRLLPITGTEEKNERGLVCLDCQH
jgi:hypothetical protein